MYAKRAANALSFTNVCDKWRFVFLQATVKRYNLTSEQLRQGFDPGRTSGWAAIDLGIA